MQLLPPWLLSAISDGDKDNPQTSCGRLIALCIVTSCVILPSILWFWLSALQDKLLDIPTSLIAFMAAAVSAAVSLYAITKNTEKQN